MGNTFKLKDRINIIGKFNKFLTVRGKKCAGWIVEKSKWSKKDLEDFLSGKIKLTAKDKSAAAVTSPTASSSVLVVAPAVEEAIVKVEEET